jgi:hypothetical protein
MNINMQRPDGRGEPARTMRQSLEGRAGRGEDGREGERRRGDLRRVTHTMDIHRGRSMRESMIRS